MSNRKQQQEIAELERLNAELSSSLRRCREILADCHSKLASNSNAPDEPDEDSVAKGG